MYVIEESGGTPVVRVRGEVDMNTAAEFRKSIATALERTSNRIVIALDECTYFDSTAVGILVGTQKKVGNRLVVVIPDTGVVRKIFDIAGVDRYVALAASLDEAIETKLL